MPLIEVRPIGAVLTTDADGFLVSQSSIERIASPWKKVIEEAVDACRSVLEDTVHSIYVRGSVSRGEAIEGISDLDLVIVVKEWPADELLESLAEERRLLEHRYPFCEGIETSIQLLERIVSGGARNWFLLKVYSVCVYGEDLIKGLPGVSQDELQCCTLFI